MIKISPSIASSNLMDIRNELNKIEGKYENLHIDIEDGNFVPNITFGMKFINQISKITSLPLSVHLMVTNPEQYISHLAKLNCTHIFVHVEHQDYLKRIINEIKKHNIKAGIAINPITNIKNYDYIFDDIDAVLYMSSEPDGMGENFIDSVLKKVDFNLKSEKWIDGGIKADKVKYLESLGFDYCVIGRDIFKNDS